MESNQGQTCIDPLPSGSVVCVIAALNRYSTWWSARSLSTCGWRFGRCLGSSKNLLYNIETNYAQQICFYPTWLIMIRRPCSAVCCKCHLSLEITYLHYLLSYLTTIADPWYFDRAFVFQRLLNQSLYQEIILLQKFIDISGKVLKPKKIQPPTSKKKLRPFFIFSFF